MEDNVANSFTMMMNKLHYCDVVVIAHRDVLRKAWREAQGERLKSLEAGLAENSINQLNLIAQRGRMDQALFHTEMDALQVQEVQTRAEIDIIMDDQVAEAEKLLAVVQAWGPKKTFKPETFEMLVEKVVVVDREHFEFHFKCGLVLTEGVVYELPEAKSQPTPQPMLQLPEAEVEIEEDTTQRQVITIRPVRETLSRL